MPEKLIANYQKARMASLVGAVALYVLGTSCIATLLIYLIAVFQIGGTAEHLFRALIPICSLLSISISVIMLAEFFRHFFTDYSPFNRRQSVRLICAAVALSIKTFLDGLLPSFEETALSAGITLVPQSGLDLKVVVMVVFLVCLAMVVRYGDALKEDSDAFV